jgi:predicted aspartyl protease
VHSGFWWGDLRERNHLVDTGVDGKIIIKMDFQEVGWGAWTGFIWLRIGTGGGFL